MDTIVFSFKKLDQSKLSIFYFKKFSSGVSPLQNCCCLPWPGLLRVSKVRWRTFVRKLKHGLNVLICKIFFLCVGFLSCVDTCFFCFVCAKLVMRSFCLDNLCVLSHVLKCFVQNQMCMYLLASLFFVFTYVFACLPYFFQCFLVVLNGFFLPH